MAALFSLPPLPNAVSYSLQYSDPISGNVNAPNPLGPWSNVGSGTFTSTSNIIDSTGSANQQTRLYRAAPTINVNGTPFTYGWSNPFSVAMSDPGVYEYQLFDAQITQLIPLFRAFIGDDGVQQTASTSIDLDTGAGTGLLQPDGTTTVFNLADMPDAVPAIILEGRVVVVKNGTTLLNNTDYYVNYDAGQVVFASAPAADDEIDITFLEVRYTNRVLNKALSNSVDRLASLGINGYGLAYDNNVCLLTASINEGLRYIVFRAAHIILNNAVIWAKAQAARAYKIGDFQMDTAPSRILDGMSNQTQADFSEIKDAVDKYIRTSTYSYSYGDYDSFLNINGLLPSWSALYLMNPYSYWI